MDRFFDMLDLGENVKRGLNAVRGLYGLPALITAIPLALIAFLFASLAWHFDLQPTFAWTAVAVAKLQPTFVGSFADYLPILVFTMTMLPSLIELFTVKFARADIAMAEWLVYFFVAFDLVTDWPAASVFVQGYVDAGVFARLGALAWIAEYAAKIAWLLLASFGFEMLAVVFGICALALFLSFSANRAPRHTNAHTV
jgi:hypothetical protein